MLGLVDYVGFRFPSFKEFVGCKVKSLLEALFDSLVKYKVSLRILYED